MRTAIGPKNIRPAIAEDAAAIADLLRQLGYDVTASGAARRLGLLGSTGCDPIYLAIEGERPLGLIAMHWTLMLQAEGPVARITALVVDEQERRREIGRQLLEHAIAAARRAGCVRIELTTALDRADAHRFYRANGFTATSLRFSREIGTDQ